MHLIGNCFRSISEGIIATTAGQIGILYLDVGSGGPLWQLWPALSSDKQIPCQTGPPWQHGEGPLEGIEVPSFCRLSSPARLQED